MISSKKPKIIPHSKHSYMIKVMNFNKFLLNRNISE
jgi:hypothetical protein